MQDLNSLPKTSWKHVAAGDLTITLHGSGATGQVCIGGTRVPLRQGASMCSMLYVYVASDDGPIVWQFDYDGDDRQRILMHPTIA